MPPQSSPTRSEPGRLTPGARLLTAAAAIAILWLLILPRAAQWPAVRSMIDRNEALGIDPSAKFYSELPLMPEVRERMQRMRLESTGE